MFTPFSLNGLEIPNRIMRSATFENLALPGGAVSPEELVLYEALAAGGVGLIVSGITAVHKSGILAGKQNSLNKDKFIPGLKQLTDAVHDHGAKIAVQLFHGGRECAKTRREDGPPAWAPSGASFDRYFSHDNYRAMTEAEIWEVTEAFGTAAARAREAGFDAVQIHGAHAYLVSEFLSPHTNHRNDQWGGSLENRLRFHLEILKAIRSQVGDEYPVFIKMGLADGFSGGLEEDQGLQAAQLLAEAGYDALEISQGLRGADYSESEFRTKVGGKHGQAYFRQWAIDVKKRVQVPVIMVGGLRTPELIEEILAGGEADLAALSRPLISEPGLIKRWQSGGLGEPRCISCNKCFETILKGNPLKCILEKKAAGTEKAAGE